MNLPLEINVNLSLKEVQKFSLGVLFKKIKIIVYIGSAILVISIISTILKAFSDGTSLIQSVWDVLSFLMPYGFIIFFVPWLFKRQIAKAYKLKQKQYESILYTFDEDQVTIKAEGIDSRMDWSNFIKVTDEKEFVAMHQSKAIVNPIPKRCFASPEVMEQFMKFATAKLAAK